MPKSRISVFCLMAERILWTTGFSRIGSFVTGLWLDFPD